MKNIIKFAVGNPVTICMIVFALLLLGKVSYDQLSVDLLPDLNNPRLFIELKAGERPPEEIEKQFVKNMESMVIRQSDVTQVSSVIKAGTARITVEYTWTKDMDEAFLDLQKAMNPFAQNKEITELKITQHDANLSPVVLIGMSHQNITDMAELRKIADSYIRNELIRLEGVADVTLSGEEVTTLTVQTDPYKLGAFQLKIEDIASRIESNNQSISGGRVSELGLQYLVKSSSLFSTEADFENLIVDNCIISDSNRGISIQIRDGGSVTNASFSNIIIETRRFADCWWGCGEPITISTHNRDEHTPSGHIKNIRFFNITCDSENGVFLSGSDKNHIEDVLFEHVSVTVHSKSKWPKGMYDLRPGINQGIEEINSAGFFMRRADDVVLRNCRVKFEGNERDKFGEALFAQDCENLSMEGFSGKAARAGVEDIRIL